MPLPAPPPAVRVVLAGAVLAASCAARAEAPAEAPAAAPAEAPPAAADGREGPADAGTAADAGGAPPATEPPPADAATDTPAAERGRTGPRHVLVVRDVPGRCRRRPATLRLTSAELAGDLERYFSGQAPRLGFLAQVFTEGRIKYCTRHERHRVEAVLAEVGTRERLAHERQWRDWVFIWGTWHLRRRLEEARKLPDLSEPARARIEHALHVLAVRLDPGRGR